jgi:hypothetical protein
MVQGRIQWRTVVNTVMKLWVPWRQAIWWTSDYCLLKMVSTAWSWLIIDNRFECSCCMFVSENWDVVCGILVCDTVWTYRWLPTLRMNVLLPSSGRIQDGGDAFLRNGKRKTTWYFNTDHHPRLPLWEPQITESREMWLLPLCVCLFRSQ